MLVFIDCDSTLSSLEGIDELAKLRGEKIKKEVEELTSKAMEGELSIHEVYKARLDLILPTLKECELVGQRYIETVEPTATQAVRRLRSAGWTPIILSGGHTQVIQPLARYLDVERVEAVDLLFEEDGKYQGFDEHSPCTRNGGKPEAIASLKAELGISNASVMIGDGISDLEAQTTGEVDLFVGFGAFVERQRVRAEAEAWVTSLSEAVDHILAEFPNA